MAFYGSDSGVPMYTGYPSRVIDSQGLCVGIPNGFGDSKLVRDAGNDLPTNSYSSDSCTSLTHSSYHTGHSPQISSYDSDEKPKMKTDMWRGKNEQPRQEIIDRRASSNTTVSKVQKHLWTWYKDSFACSPALPWCPKFRLHMDDHRFLHLLQCSTSNSSDAFSDSLYYDSISIDRLVAPRSLKDGIRPRILIEGGSGAGKTTLGVKLAYDWAKGDVGAVQGYHLCFVIPLRYYDGSLMNLIQKEILTKQFSGKASLLEIYEYMRSNDDKLLLVLDGWEELPTARPCQNAAQSHSELIDIINGRVFPRSCVVVMSNPGINGSELRRYVPRVYYIRGFEIVQIRQFVHGYFKSIDKPDDAEKVLRSSIMHSADLRSTLLSTPVMCLLTCLLFEDSHAGYSAETASRIYEDLMQLILRRASEKRGTAGGRHIVARDVGDFLLRILGKLSLKFMGEDKTLFSEQELRDCDAYQAVEFGLLNRGWALSRREKHVLVQPLHRTFPFFWTAKYLASISPTRTTEVLDGIRSADKEMWLRFLVGCMKANAYLIFERFQFEVIPTKKLFALLKENGHHGRSVNAVCELLNTRSRAQIQMDPVELEGWAMVLGDPSCSMDNVEIILKQRSVLSDPALDKLFAALRLNESVKTVRLGTSLSQDLTSADIKVISQYMRMVIQKPKLQSLELVFRSVDDDKTGNNGFGPLVQVLCNELRRGMVSPTLTKVVVDVDMAPDQVVALCRALECCPNIQVVHLLHLVCTRRSFAGVANLVSSRPLLSLNLTGSWYPDDGDGHRGLGYADRVGSSSFDVKSSRSSSSGGATSPVWANYGPDIGSLRRFNTLRRNPHPPPVCDPNEHSRASGFHEVFQSMKDGHCRLKTLNVARCSFSKMDIVCLGEVLHRNGSLDSLRVQGLSKIDHVFPLVLGLQENMTLQLLDLSSSHVTMTDFPFQCFTQALSRTSALKSLSIAGWTLKLEEPRSFQCLESFLRTCSLRDLNLAGCRFFVSVEDNASVKHESLVEAISKNLQSFAECGVAFLNLSSCQVVLSTSRGQFVLHPPDLIPFLVSFTKLTSLNASMKKDLDGSCKLGEKSVLNFFQGVGNHLVNLRELTVSDWFVQMENPEKVSKTITRSLKHLGLKALTMNRFRAVDGLGQKSLVHVFMSAVLFGLPDLSYFSMKGTSISREEIGIVARCLLEKHRGPYLDLSMRHLPADIFREFRSVLLNSGKANLSMVRCTLCQNQELRVEFRPPQNSGVWEKFACSLK